MDEQPIPDVGCEGVQVQVSPFGLMINLTQGPPTQGPLAPKSVADIRMSLEHAKVAAIMLRNILKQHEEQQGSIVLEPHLYKQLGVSPEEDWSW